MGNKISSFDKMTMLKELQTGTLCELSHGVKYEEKDILAVNYISLPMGINGQVTEHLTWAICKECEEALQGEEWVLMACLNCGQTRWVSRRHSKLDYINKETGLPYKMVLFQTCLDCTGEFTGIHYIVHNQFKFNLEVN